MYNYKQKVTNKNKSSTNKKVLYGFLIVVALALVAGSIYVFKDRSNKKSVDTTEQTINYEPATKEEKKESENAKDKIIEQKNTQSNSSSSSTNQKTPVKPTITNTTGSINAYVTGIFEEGGTCTAIFSKDTTTLTKSSTGFQNVSYTQCAPINLDTGFLSPGKWAVIVKYSSDKSEGSSEPQTIEVK